MYLASIARFTSLDPVAGGTANNYVYALDPINQSDYSGNCLQACSGIVLQGSTVNLQARPISQQALNTSSPIHIARTNSSTRIHIATATTSILRMVRNNSTALPIAGVVSLSGDVAGGIKRQSSVFGLQLRQGSSVAGRNLRSVSKLAKNPAIRVVGRYAGPVGIGLDFAGNYLGGDSLGRNALKTGFGAGGGAAGAWVGGAACGTAAVATFGLGVATCPVLIGGSAAAGSWAGNKIGEGLAGALDW